MFDCTTETTRFCSLSVATGRVNDVSPNVCGKGMYAILARACVFLMQQYSEEQFINVGSGSDVTIKELAGLVREAAGFQGEILWDHSKPDGTPRKLMDSSRLFALGWRPQIDLETGIRMASEDFRSQMKPMGAS